MNFQHLRGGKNRSVQNNYQLIWKASLSAFSNQILWQHFPKISWSDLQVGRNNILCSSSREDEPLLETSRPNWLFSEPTLTLRDLHMVVPGSLLFTYSFFLFLWSAQPNRNFCVHVKDVILSWKMGGGASLVITFTGGGPGPWFF